MHIPWLRLPALGVLLLAAGCASGDWDKEREETARPLQRLLHRHLPDAIGADDKEKVLSFHGGPDPAKVAAPFLELWTRFKEVERSRCVIERFELNDKDPIKAHISLRVEGTDPAGKRLALDQLLDVECRQEAAGWKITAAKVVRDKPSLDPGFRFADETAARGIEVPYEHALVPDRRGRQVPCVSGSGVAVGDVDRDGWEDAILVDARGPRLFLNKEGQFQDATAGSGLDAPMAGVPTAPVLGDVDNDGLIDLLVTALQGPHRLWKNLGGGKWEQRPEKWLGGEIGYAVAACMADFDKDGWVDIFIAQTTDLVREEPWPMGAAKNAYPDVLLRNRKDGSFEDVTEEAGGLGDTGWALACSAGDFDGDGDIDIFTSNDFGLDALWCNLGDGTFEEVSQGLGVDKAAASMSADWGDADGDGDLDMFVSGMHSGSAWMLFHPDFPSPAPWYIDLFVRDRVIAAFHEFFLGNRLYLNQGPDKEFVEVAKATDSIDSQWAWGAVWLDADNDGRLDIYNVNGFITGEDPTDL